jgi:DUF4097 and DUF4098 domain-containing protein YvlB
LRISAVSGRVTVTAEPRSDVVVDRGGVTAAGPDGTVEIRAGRPSDALAVRCPEGADVVVGTTSGNVELAGRFGTIGVTSQSGSIHVASVSEADLRTVSGRIELGDCEGRCRVSTTSGRIRVAATRDVEVSTTSGSIGLDAVSGAAQAQSVSGSVRVASAGRGPITIRTVSGSVTINLPASVRPAVHSSGYGKVHNGFQAGDDVVVEIANVSGRVKLLPA